MSLNRLIALAVFLGALAIAVPEFAPGLVSIVQPSIEAEDSAHAPVAGRRPSADEARLGRDSGDAGRISRPGGRSVAVKADKRGHYQTDAMVNGRSITVIVDTGATTVALNAATARRLGIFLTRSDYSVPISTANGTVAAAPVTLSEIRLGGIAVRHVDAVVVPGEVLPINLLGMSFLSRLSRFEIAGGQLVLVE